MAETRMPWLTNRSAHCAALILALLPSAVWSVSLRHGQTKKLNAEYRLKLNNFNNVQYSGPLTIGSQTLPVIYDTGSFEILVLSSQCQMCSRIMGVYNQARSTTFAVPDPPITTEHLFGSGSAISNKGFDTIQMGDTRSPYLGRHMPFWQVVSHQIPVWDENSHFAGIVGLGKSERVPEGFTAEGSNDMTMASELGITNFAICLERGANAPGWLIANPYSQGLLSSSFASHFKDVPVVGDVHWGVKMTNLHMAGVMMPDPCVPSCGAIVDSGTSLIAAPTSASQIVRALSNMIKSDCSNLHTLPTLRFKLGDADVELPPKAYVIKVSAPQDHRNASLWSRIFGKGVKNECTAAFMTIDKDSDYGPVWILGMPFLRYYYTVFDRAAKKIHLARSSPTCQPGMDTYGAMLNATIMVNSTHSNASSGDLSMSHFTPADYEPMPADLNAARAPIWALDKGKLVF